MIIVAAYNRHTKENLTEEQIQVDMPELLKEHEAACEESMTWDFFGGVIVLGDHEYQVT
jgi:hypothetical protein